MNKQSQIDLLDIFNSKMRGLLIDKGDDYSDGDRLSNFKNAGSIIGVSPEISCLDKMATKIIRLGNLLNNSGTPKNESIEDSIIDLANYSFLLYCLIYENK